MTTRRLAVIGALALTLAWPGSAAAQDEEFEVGRIPGWVFTPSMAFGASFDDNPVLAAGSDPSPNDRIMVVRPAVDLRVTERHWTVDGGYSGALSRYATFSEFNAYDQAARVALQAQPGRHWRLFSRNSYSITPTTDAVQLAGVPFFRTGTRHNEFEVGAAVNAAKNLQITGTYRSQWLQFDRNSDAPNAAFLQGGHSQMASLDVRRPITERIKLGVSYSYEHADVGTLGNTFDIQDAQAVFNMRVAKTVSVEAGAGVSHVALTDPFQSRTGPAFRGSVRKNTERLLFSFGVMRSFVPSFGFGGSLRNQEVNGSVRARLARRMTAEGSLAWRRSEPVFARELALKGVWINGVLSYRMQRWLFLQGFYTGARQDTVVTGGPVVRNRFGVRVATSHPMRID